MNFDYHHFIEEIAALVSQAKNFDDSQRSHESDAFRKWRHKVDDLITAIERQGYPINCSLSHRQFRILSYSWFSPRDELEVFNRDLKDTINELELIIEQYGKYGDPHSRQSKTQPLETKKELEAPEHFTLKWLYDHMPLSWWAWIVGALITVCWRAFKITQPCALNFTQVL